MNKLLLLFLLLPSSIFAYTDKYYSEGPSGSGGNWILGVLFLPFFGLLLLGIIKEFLRLIFKIDFDDEEKDFDQWKKNAIKKTKKNL